MNILKNPCYPRHATYNIFCSSCYLHEEVTFQRRSLNPDNIPLPHHTKNRPEKQEKVSNEDDV